MSSKPLPIKLIHQPRLYFHFLAALSRFGVNILWGPSGSGKSTYLKYFFECKTSCYTTTFIDCEKIHAYQHLSKWFRQSLQETKKYHNKNKQANDKEIKTRNCKPEIVIINKADNLLIRDDAKEFIISLAKEAANDKKFQVFLSTTNEDIVKKALQWNGGEKINHINVDFAFTQTQVEEFIAEVIKTKRIVNLKKLNKIGMISRNPGIILAASEELSSKKEKSLYAPNPFRTLTQIAVNCQYKWQRGRSVLFIEKNS